MEDHQAGQDSNRSPNNVSERNEPVRSRWTPKPEQILVLESIFNSGMVNPPKDETVRIRKLLEKFGSVGDANVFYWFQNRRSRSRRRQRQMQAALDQQRNINQGQDHVICGSAVQFESVSSSVSAATDFGASPCFASSSTTYLPAGSSSSSDDHGVDGISSSLFPASHGQTGFPGIEHSSAVTPDLCPSDTSNLHFSSGLIIVFINGVPTEIPKGPLDVKAVFGQDTLLVHSSGVPVLTNDYGILAQGLQHGESYFLVSIPT